MKSSQDKKKKKEIYKTALEKSAEAATNWLGSTSSLVFHTCLFIVAAILPFLGIRLDLVLLVLTTAVSLEAIYMNIFIQMAVNKNTVDIEEIQEDVDEIQEDIEEIGEDVDEIQKDVDEIQKDVDEIQEDIEEDQEATKEEKEVQALVSIQTILTNLQQEIEQLKKK
jgi:low affinity Fe/Cu permease